MKTWITTVAIIVATCFAVIASGQHHHSKATLTVKKTAVVCPVTGDKIISVHSAVGHSTYKGKTYYFCCAGCKPRFDKSPAKFVKNAAQGKFEKM